MRNGLTPVECRRVEGGCNGREREKGGIRGDEIFPARVLYGNWAVSG